MGGETMLLYIDVGEEPGADADVDGNRRKLSKLQTPFSAIVEPERGRGAESDGHFRWAAPMTFSRTIVCKDGVARGGTVEARPRTVPLEIGTTAVSRTLLHTRITGVARWPYKSKRIVVILPFARA